MYQILYYKIFCMYIQLMILATNSIIFLYVIPSIRKKAIPSTDESQFGFVPGRGTTDAIFVVRQLQEKYLSVGKRLYMAFVDLEKAELRNRL